MLAYHNNPQIKADILAQLEEHRAADELVKGQYWWDGKGCAVGCTIHSDDHAEYETRYGIPEMLAYLEDCIFEGLPHAEAQQWPIRFMSAIEPGQNLSRVGWQFLHRLLTDPDITPGITHSLVAHAVRACADVIEASMRDGNVDIQVAEAVGAARAAEAAASEVSEAAARAARAAYVAAEAVGASRAASAVYSAAYAAADAAPRGEKMAAKEAAYTRMADTLIETIEWTYAKS